MFDRDGFVIACREAVRDGGVLALRDVVERTVRDPATARSLEPTGSTFDVYHHDDELTVLHLTMAPGVSSLPHEHTMAAVVGIVGGQEDNEFYRRQGDGIEESGGREVRAGEVLVMGDDAVHAIRNPVGRYTVGLHVYAGDLPAATRSEWDPRSGVRRPCDNAFGAEVTAAVHDEEQRLGRLLTRSEVDQILTRLGR